MIRAEPHPDTADSLAPSKPSAPRAIFSPQAHLQLWLPAALVLAADLITKHVAFERLSYLHPYWVIRGVLYLQLSINRGAVFGLLPGWGIIFVLASLVAAAFVIYLFAFCHPRQWGVHLALGLILGGTFGNLYDRLFCIADIAGAGTPSELRGIAVENNDHPDQYTIVGYPHGREVLGQVLGPITRQPVVRDFIKIDVQIGSRPLWKWIFNIADAALVIGVILLLLLSLRHRRPRTTSSLSSTA
jgi:lipoprotein signal peptidase